MGYIIWLLICMILGGILGAQGWQEPMLGGVIGTVIGIIGILIWYCKADAAASSAIEDATDIFGGTDD